jgi:hypothetical protein
MPASNDLQGHIRPATVDEWLTSPPLGPCRGLRGRPQQRPQEAADHPSHQKQEHGTKQNGNLDKPPGRDGKPVHGAVSPIALTGHVEPAMMNES